MNILHILRSEPDALIRYFMSQNTQDEKSVVVQLYDENIDYDQLLEQIFVSDKAISWW